MKSFVFAMMAAMVCSTALLGACSFDSSALQECSSNSDCGPGKVCGEANFCIRGDRDVSDQNSDASICVNACSTGAICCGEKCVPEDNENCGDCGNSCGDLQICISGVCECVTGYGDCDGMVENGCETYFSNSPEHCGACGNTCNGITEMCLGGFCSCNVGYTTCLEGVSYGCETDILNDEKNCGACGIQCNSGETCNGNGNCNCGANQSCGEGEVCCLQEGKSVCVRTDTSVNCGGCGIKCNSGEHCENGVCKCGTRESCGDGWICCNESACTLPDSCSCGSEVCGEGQSCCSDNCVDLLTNLWNCGACGVAVSELQVCQNGTPVCKSGTAYCNGSCQNIVSDSSNCGGCGVVCPSQNGSASCTGAQCVLECSEGFGNCNNIPADGCEKSVWADPENCGSCGNLCTADESCRNGECQATCLCGNHVCDVDTVLGINERITCPQDCPYSVTCGDNYCDAKASQKETLQNCPDDCNFSGEYCGNNSCNGAKEEFFWTCSDCIVGSVQNRDKDGNGDLCDYDPLGISPIRENCANSPDCGPCDAICPGP